MTTAYNDILKLTETIISLIEATESDDYITELLEEIASICNNEKSPSDKKFTFSGVNVLIGHHIPKNTIVTTEELFKKITSTVKNKEKIEKSL